jgi:hypothetical protein
VVDRGRIHIVGRDLGILFTKLPDHFRHPGELLALVAFGVFSPVPETHRQYMVGIGCRDEYDLVLKALLFPQNRKHLFDGGRAQFIRLSGFAFNFDYPCKHRGTPFGHLETWVHSRKAGASCSTPGGEFWLFGDPLWTGQFLTAGSRLTIPAGNKLLRLAVKYPLAELLVCHLLINDSDDNARHGERAAVHLKSSTNVRP